MRRRFLQALTAAAVALAPAAAPAAGEVTVYKTPACGCCSKWVDHLKANGFAVRAEDVRDLNAVKARYGVQRHLASCHTAVVDGYVVEGHVPAEAIKRLLRERPAVKGVAVPGMPVGSPGMEGPNAERYDVVTFDAEGRSQVYMRY